jgi:hypothetical protein
MQRKIRGMNEAAKEAVRTAARKLRDGYGGSADDTYFMTFSVQRADDRTPGSILAWMKTETFALRRSYNSLSKTEQDARVEWERVHRPEAPWWQTKSAGGAATSTPTPTSSVTSDVDAAPRPTPTPTPTSSATSTSDAAPRPTRTPTSSATSGAVPRPTPTTPTSLVTSNANAELLLGLQTPMHSLVAGRPVEPPSSSSQAWAGHESDTFLVTALNKVAVGDVTKQLSASRREVDVLRAHATVCENITLDCFRRMLASARIWWYTGYEDNGVPIFTHEPPCQDLHIVSAEQVTSIVADAVNNGKLEIVVLNTSSTMELGRALSEKARVPFVVCWDGLIEDNAANVFGKAIAAALKAGSAPEDAFKSACDKVESRAPNTKGQTFKLQKVDDVAAGMASHARESAVPVGLPMLLTRTPTPLTAAHSATGKRPHPSSVVDD